MIIILFFKNLEHWLLMNVLDVLFIKMNHWNLFKWILPSWHKNVHAAVTNFFSSICKMVYARFNANPSTIFLGPKQSSIQINPVFFLRNLFQSTRLYIWRNIEWSTSNSVLGEEWKFMIGRDEFCHDKRSDSRICFYLSIILKTWIPGTR